MNVRARGHFGDDALHDGRTRVEPSLQSFLEDASASNAAHSENNRNQPLIEALGDKDGTVEGRRIDVMVEVVEEIVQ